MTKQIGCSVPECCRKFARMSWLSLHSTENYHLVPSRQLARLDVG